MQVIVEPVAAFLRVAALSGCGIVLGVRALAFPALQSTLCDMVKNQYYRPNS
jgi:hypothetical protein